MLFEKCFGFQQYLTESFLIAGVNLQILWNEINNIQSIRLSGVIRSGWIGVNFPGDTFLRQQNEQDQGQGESIFNHRNQSLNCERRGAFADNLNGFSD